MEELEANNFPKIGNQEDKFNLLGDNNLCTNENQGPELQEPKVQKHENPDLKARIVEIQKLINMSSQERLKIVRKEDGIKSHRNYIMYELEELHHREEGILYEMAQNWKKLDIFKLFLDKLNLTNEGEPTKSYLSREKVDKHKLYFWIRHGTTNSLAKEKRKFKQIKLDQQTDVVDYSSSFKEEELNNSSWLYRQMRSEKIHRKGAKDRVKEIIKERAWYMTDTKAEAIAQGKIRSSLSSSRKAIQDQMKVLCDELEELRKRHMGIGEEIGGRKRELRSEENEIKSFIRKKQGPNINQRKEEAHECLLKLIKQQEADQD